MPTGTKGHHKPHPSQGVLLQPAFLNHSIVHFRTLPLSCMHNSPLGEGKHKTTYDRCWSHCLNVLLEEAQIIWWLRCYKNTVVLAQRKPCENPLHWESFYCHNVNRILCLPVGTCTDCQFFCFVRLTSHGHSVAFAPAPSATSHIVQGQFTTSKVCLEKIHIQHAELTFYQYFWNFSVAGTEGTVQLETVSVVKKGSTQGKQHFLGFKVQKQKTHQFFFR